MNQHTIPEAAFERGDTKPWTEWVFHRALGEELTKIYTKDILKPNIQILTFGAVKINSHIKRNSPYRQKFQKTISYDQQPLEWCQTY